jgi:hypothetical protein
MCFIEVVWPLRELIIFICNYWTEYITNIWRYRGYINKILFLLSTKTCKIFGLANIASILQRWSNIWKHKILKTHDHVRTAVKRRQKCRTLVPTDRRRDISINIHRLRRKTVCESCNDVLIYINDFICYFEIKSTLFSTCVIIPHQSGPDLREGSYLCDRPCASTKQKYSPEILQRYLLL